MRSDKCFCLCNLHHIQDIQRKFPSFQKIPSCLCAVKPPLSPVLGSHWPAFCHYMFFACGSSPSASWFWAYGSLLSSMHCMDIWQLVSHPPAGVHLGVSSIGPLWITLLCSSKWKPLCGVCFHFSWLNSSEWVRWQVHVETVPLSTVLAKGMYFWKNVY